jgi:hypothetical protein
LFTPLYIGIKGWLNPSHPLNLTALCYFFAPPEASLPVEVRDNSQDANDDEINPDEIVKYLGENHYNDAENKRDYAP